MNDEEKQRIAEDLGATRHFPMKDPQLGMPAPPIPDDPTEAERLAAEEHVAEIMFDSGGEVEKGCVLCEAGVRLGVWAHYGIEDPFAEDDA